MRDDQLFSERAAFQAQVRAEQDRQLDHDTIRASQLQPYADRISELEGINAFLQERIERLEEAATFTLNNLDYLRNLWGDEGVTRGIADRLRAALDPDPQTD